jgi:hypothetical protein
MKLNCKKIKLKTQDGSKGVSEQKCMKWWKCCVKEMVKKTNKMHLKYIQSHRFFGEFFISTWNGKKHRKANSHRDIEEEKLHQAHIWSIFEGKKVFNKLEVRCNNKCDNMLRKLLQDNDKSRS